MNKIKIESKYDVKRVTTDCSCDKPLTKQSFKDQCDVNKIMAKFDKTGLFSHVNPNAGWYDDIPGDMDFHKAQNMVLQGEAAFMALPANIRTEFDNDPGRFLDFAMNPENENKMREMGLLKPSAKTVVKASDLEKTSTGGNEGVSPETK